MVPLYAASVGAGAGPSRFGEHGHDASLALMLDRVPASGYSTVSAVWNLAYDTGLGVGAAGFGLLIAPVGYPASDTDARP